MTPTPFYCASCRHCTHLEYMRISKTETVWIRPRGKMADRLSVIEKSYKCRLLPVSARAMTVQNRKRMDLLDDMLVCPCFEKEDGQ